MAALPWEIVNGEGNRLLMSLRQAEVTRRGGSTRGRQSLARHIFHALAWKED
jgi:hypothetical protein